VEYFFQSGHGVHQRSGGNGGIVLMVGTDSDDEALDVGRYGTLAQEAGDMLESAASVGCHAPGRQGGLGEPDAIGVRYEYGVFVLADFRKCPSGTQNVQVTF